MGHPKEASTFIICTSRRTSFVTRYCFSCTVETRASSCSEILVTNTEKHERSCYGLEHTSLHGTASECREGGKRARERSQRKWEGADSRTSEGSGVSDEKAREDFLVSLWRWWCRALRPCSAAAARLMIPVPPSWLSLCTAAARCVCCCRICMHPQKAARERERHIYTAC